MKMVDFDCEAYKYNLFEHITDEDIQRLQFTQRNVKLYAFKAIYELEICGTNKNTFYLKILDDDEDKIANKYLELKDENRQLKYEIEMLKEINEQNKALIQNKWTEYLKKKEAEEND